MNNVFSFSVLNDFFSETKTGRALTNIGLGFLFFISCMTAFVCGFVFLWNVITPEYEPVVVDFMYVLRTVGYGLLMFGFAWLAMHISHKE